MSIVGDLVSRHLFIGLCLVLSSTPSLKSDPEISLLLRGRKLFLA